MREEKILKQKSFRSLARKENQVTWKRKRKMAQNEIFLILQSEERYCTFLEPAKTKVGTKNRTEKNKRRKE